MEPEAANGDAFLSRALFESLQLFTGLKADRLARRNGHLGASPRVASDAGLARAHVKNAEAAQFNALTTRECPLHGLKDGLNSHLGLGLGDACAVDNFVDDIELDQERLPMIQRTRPGK